MFPQQLKQGKVTEDSAKEEQGLSVLTNLAASARSEYGRLGILAIMSVIDDVGRLGGGLYKVRW